MTTKLTKDREYRDYEPPFEWEAKKAMNTLIILLPGMFISFFCCFSSSTSI